MFGIPPPLGGGCALFPSGSGFWADTGWACGGICTGPELLGVPELTPAACAITSTCSWVIIFTAGPSGLVHVVSLVRAL